jgi:CRISPR-associated protein Csb2
VATDHLRIRNHERKDPERYAVAEQRELERLVRKELNRRPWLAEFAESVTIERTFDTLLSGTKTSWMKFRRTRQRGGGRQASTQGYGFRLSFDGPVQGPIALGYGSHFGLGLFSALPRT